MASQNVFLTLVGIVAGIALVMAIAKMLKVFFEWLIKIASAISLLLLIFSGLYFASTLKQLDLSNVNGFKDELPPIFFQEQEEKPLEQSPIREQLRVKERPLNYSSVTTSRLIATRNNLPTKRINQPLVSIESAKRTNRRVLTKPISKMYKQFKTNCEDQGHLVHHYFLVEFFCTKESNAINRVALLHKNGFEYAQYIEVDCFQTDVEEGLLAVLITPPFENRTAILREQEQLWSSSAFSFKTLRMIYLDSKYSLEP